MKLVIGFLSYKEYSAKYLAKFLPSLESALGFLTPDNYQVYAFDNSPIDHSRNRLIIESWNQKANNSSSTHLVVEYFTRQTNFGFSRAYNILINKAIKVGAKYFFMINPDTLLDSQSIQKLFNTLEQHSELSVAIPKILHWDFINDKKTKIIDSLGLTLKLGLQFSDLGQGREDSSDLYQAKIIGPSGAAALFRLTDLLQIREPDNFGCPKYFFDERFFMYKEDCDLAYRLFLAGLKTQLIPDAIIYHDRTASTLGLSLFKRIKERKKKNQDLKIWSFSNQHFIFIKYWKTQNLFNRFFIILYVFSMFIFSLVFEPSNLKQYFYIWKRFK